MPKPKTSVTKSAIPVGPEDVPVEDPAKVTKKKGRPAKTKPVTEEPIQDQEDAEMEQDPQEQEEGDVEGDEEATTSNENKENSKPGTRSKQKQAGLAFPIIRMRQFLKKGNYPLSNRKTDKWTTPIFLAGVLEYLTAEVLELAGDVAKGGKKARIAPRHIMLAVRNDEEINKLMSGVTIAAGGVVPGIHPVLLPKKSQ